MTAPGDHDLAELLAVARAGRPHPAIALADDLRRDGLGFDALIRGRLVPVMREVGRLWQRAEWSVADEHAATAVISGVLSAAALELDPPATRGEVLVACVESEYHSLPARLGAELLRHDGWAVTFLGASVPAQDLQAYAARTDPDAVVLSCTFVENLPGARRCVGAIGDLGLPAVVAGAAVAHPGVRRWLGASAHITDALDPTTVLSSPLRPAERREGRSPQALALELGATDVTDVCMARLQGSIAAMSRFTPAQLAATRADLDHLVRHLILSMDCATPALFIDLARWLDVTLSARGVPSRVLDTSLGVLGDVLAADGHAAAADLCAAGRVAIGTGDGPSPQLPEEPEEDQPEEPVWEVSAPRVPAP